MQGMMGVIDIEAETQLVLRNYRDVNWVAGGRNINSCRVIACHCSHFPCMFLDNWSSNR